MLDHVFISVSDIDRSIAFYTAVLTPLGSTRHDDTSYLGPSAGDSLRHGWRRGGRNPFVGA
jgi:catechol 2,3-dioxygenase-like lactoylglutathione lyase family enzyme